MTACVHSSRVQLDYVGQRDECRDMAERNASFYNQRTTRQGRLSPQLDTADQNAVLAKIFSDCMFVNGWTVATPAQQQPKPGQPSPQPPRNQYASNQDDLEWLTQPGTDRSTVARSRTTQPAPAAQGQQQAGNQAGQYRVQPEANRTPNSRGQAQPSPLAQSQQRSFNQPEQYRTQPTNTRAQAAPTPVPAQQNQPPSYNRPAQQPVNRAAPPAQPQAQQQPQQQPQAQAQQPYNPSAQAYPAQQPMNRPVPPRAQAPRPQPAQYASRNDDLEYLTQPGTDRSTVARGRMAQPQPQQQVARTQPQPMPQPVPRAQGQPQSFNQPEQFRSQPAANQTAVAAIAPVPALQRPLTQREKCLRWHYEQQAAQQQPRTAQQNEQRLKQQAQQASSDYNYAAICQQYLAAENAANSPNTYIPNGQPAPAQVRKSVNPRQQGSGMIRP